MHRTNSCETEMSHSIKFTTLLKEAAYKFLVRNKKVKLCTQLASRINLHKSKKFFIQKCF